MTSRGVGGSNVDWATQCLLIWSVEAICLHTAILRRTFYRRLDRCSMSGYPSRSQFCCFPLRPRRQSARSRTRHLRDAQQRPLRPWQVGAFRQQQQAKENARGATDATFSSRDPLRLLCVRCALRVFFCLSRAGRPVSHDPMKARRAKRTCRPWQVENHISLSA